MTASEDREREIAKDFWLWVDKQLSFDLFLGPIHFCSVLAGADSTFNICLLKEKLVVPHVSLFFQDFAIVIALGMLQEVWGGEITDTSRDKALELVKRGRGWCGRAEKEVGGPEWEHYAVKSSSLLRVWFESRHRGPAGWQQEGVSLPPSAQTGSMDVGRSQSNALPPPPRDSQALTKRHLRWNWSENQTTDRMS